MKEDIKETRLPNGMVVLSDRMTGVRSVTLGLFFRVGSRHEPTELNGISHFIEHTVFKGTARRTALELAVEQDALGGGLDAFTSHEETGFAIKCIDDQLSRAFDLLVDIVTAPTFDETDLKNEQKVIIEELKMVEDSPEEYLGDIFSAAIFPRHPLGLSIAGTAATVKSFDSKKVRSYHRQAFNPSNLIIAAAGNLEHDDLLGLVQEHFNQDRNGGSRSRIEGPAPQPLAPIVLKQRNDLEQVHLIIASPLVAATDERRYPADLLSTIIGGGVSSRLWQKVREERGLAYSIGASAALYQDCGLFTISAGTSPDQVVELVDITMAELRDVAAAGVTETELDLAKQQTTASILLGLEDSAVRAGNLSQAEMIHGRQITLDESLSKINAVTAAEIQALARESFVTDRISFAALGELGDVKITRDNLQI